MESKKVIDGLNDLIMSVFMAVEKDNKTLMRDPYYFINCVKIICESICKLAPVDDRQQAQRILGELGSYGK